MTELSNKRKKTVSPRTPSYAIFGNIFEQRTTGKGNKKPMLLKRYVVSTEFIQLFYNCVDGDFDAGIFNDLPDNEKFLLSKMLIFLKTPENRAFNIAMSKFAKTLYERLKVIEMAVKAGNLSKILQNEYYEIMDKMVDAGMLKKHQGSYQKTNMRNTKTVD